MTRRLLAILVASLLWVPGAANALMLKAMTSGLLASSSSIDGTNIGGSGFELTGLFDTEAGTGSFALTEIVVSVDGYGDIFLAPETSFNTFRIYFVDQPDGVRVGFGKSTGGWFLTYDSFPLDFDPASPTPGEFSLPVVGSFAENSTTYPTLGQGPFQFGVVEDGIGPVTLEAAVPVPATLPLLTVALAAIGVRFRFAKRAG